MKKNSGQDDEKGSKTGSKRKKQTAFRISKAARSELERIKKKEGLTFDRAVEDRILGISRFRDEIETMISNYQTKHGCGRDYAIEGLIMEAARRIARLEEPAPGPAAIPTKAELAQRVRDLGASLRQMLKELGGEMPGIPPAPAPDKDNHSSHNPAA